MFQIKICGIATAEDAQMVVAAGADAVGLNFYPASKRYLQPAVADAIVGEVPPHVVKVGVFVNAAVEEVRTAAHRFRLDLVQLHGDEPPQMIAELKDLRVIRALRCRDSLDPALRYLEACEAAGKLPEALLVDAYDPTQYGGTGKTVDWKLFAADRIAATRDRTALPLFAVPLILAGGLTAENVQAAIETVGPAAVDTASGVESVPRRKSPERVAAFIRNAREAFERTRSLAGSKVVNSGHAERHGESS